MRVYKPFSNSGLYKKRRNVLGKNGAESGIVSKQPKPDGSAHRNQSQYGKGKSPPVRSVAGDIEHETEGERCKKCHAESDKRIERQSPAKFGIMCSCSSCTSSILRLDASGIATNKILQKVHYLYYDAYKI